VSDDPLDILRQRYPFPDVSGVEAWHHSLGGYGREMIDQLIQRTKPKVMLEIGCFMGASAQRWLEVDPNIVLIGIDPWDDGLIEQCWRYVGRPTLTRIYPELETQKAFARAVETQGPFLTAMANMVDYKDRFIPMRGYSPDALFELAELGIAPDIIYIDCNKKPDELDVSHKLWPDAVITGDDWHWSRSKGYPMRKIVTRFAEQHNYKVRAEHATWILE